MGNTGKAIATTKKIITGQYAVIGEPMVGVVVCNSKVALKKIQLVRRKYKWQIR